MLRSARKTCGLGNDVLHSLVDDIVPPPPKGRDAWVLDFNCGAGDDLARFLARNWHAAGCDGSSGMLRAAAARCARDLEQGRLQLWQGQAEELPTHSLPLPRDGSGTP
jgi:ubiquinone/menaquinone biosynthesis C-methylase UbiE